ncbi:hypothetical protein KDA_06320 [Dictyobacter alpinus]|uniref:CBM6 domain-containing protein n=1 Tax=Dictyobacter alpinus TaxID=2014873 RepID=A0A402B1D1_9CHLR|nr:carbohydrate-binding protein [Dictyobacter alpinus]GCE25148.1 hypothetical protein KDA_06320 [Dictyobacter alpinus]
MITINSSAKKRFFALFLISAVLCLAFQGLVGVKSVHAAYGSPVRHEAETTNLANATVESIHSGYSGSGYVTGLTSEWSKLTFDQGVNDDTLAQIDIRYANGTGATVSNLSLYVGSDLIQKLSFPVTDGWDSWATQTVTFTIPGGYQNIVIKSEAKVDASINIDYLDLSLDDGLTPVPPGSFNQNTPEDGASNVSTTTAFAWGASSKAASYQLVVSSNSDYSSPAINVNNLTGTSYTPDSALKDSTKYYWKVTATNAAGSKVSSNAGISFTTAAPPPPPGSFNQTAPANGATGISVAPAFSWDASSNGKNYELVVSTKNDYSSPAIDAKNLTGTSYTPDAVLKESTKYYWKVTATNSVGSKVATNAGISFTTAAPTPPGDFSQLEPVDGATNVSTTPGFAWGASPGATSYALVVSTQSDYSSPEIDVNNLTGTSYTPAKALSDTTKYYWKVTATSAAGSTVATNSGISFTTSTAPAPGTNYYVAPNGSDSAGDGTANKPWKTLAYAATKVPAGINNTINLAAGTYNETVAVVLPLGVNIKGAGENNTIITSNGPIPTPGVDQNAGDWKLWYDGSLIQLISPGYSGTNPKYGSPDQMVDSANGNQTLSDFTVDGNNHQIKAGVWVENRNNVTMHHVTFKDFQMRGAVFGRSDMWWYIPLPDGKWMYNTTIHDCTFINSGSQQNGESLGNLNIAGLDGANIYNITINDDQGGFGIKFIFVGHYRNVKIHDSTIHVSEFDDTWGEKASIEMWNLSYGNDIYNINCNTWLSFVNHTQLTAYLPVGNATNNLKLHGIKMIDQDGNNGNESVEASLSGMEIYDNYFQDKGYGIAIWHGGGYDLKNFIVRNNIFANVKRAPGFGFGQSSGVFVPDPTSNIKIYNNVFDNMGNGLTLDNANGVDVKNNVFLNTLGADVEGGSNVTFMNNLKYHTDPQKAGWNLTGGPTLGSGNLLGNPGFKNTGNRWDTYYQPASSSSLVVDAGVDVGLPFNGSAPDIGRWES